MNKKSEWIEAHLELDEIRRQRRHDDLKTALENEEKPYWECVVELIGVLIWIAILVALGICVAIASVFLWFITIPVLIGAYVNWANNPAVKRRKEEERKRDVALHEERLAQARKRDAEAAEKWRKRRVAFMKWLDTNVGDDTIRWLVILGCPAALIIAIIAMIKYL